MELKFGWYRIVLILVILACLALILFQNTEITGNFITGFLTEGSTTSNVSIQKYLAIALCTNLASGISFGDVTSLPVSNLNGTHNYDNGSSGSTYCMNVSLDGNTAIDACIRGDGPLNTTGGDAIGLDNETYYNSTDWTNLTIPALVDEVPLTTGYVKAGSDIAVGSLNFYRFWLDIPAAQPSGEYNNTVYFKGVQTTFSC